MIEYLHLYNITCFDTNKLDFSPGVNVLIGKNGTGKTHVMKCLEAGLKANKDLENAISKSKGFYGELLTKRLLDYFRPDSLNHLLRKGTNSGSVLIKMDDGKIAYHFGKYYKLVKTTSKPEKLLFQKSIYIPPREMLSLYEGFLSLYENREIAFDATYVELAKSLDANVLKGERFEEAKELLKPILETWNFEVKKENNRFYLIDGKNEFEAHLVAEGFRKIASLFYLIVNGEITRDSILFWDEPEANLNPSLIKVVASLIISLAKAGVQIFIASHDYLLTHLLSLNAEYKKEVEMRFFSFFKNGESGINIEDANTLPEIQNNSILDEYAAYYDLENECFDE